MNKKAVIRILFVSVLSLTLFSCKTVYDAYYYAYSEATSAEAATLASYAGRTSSGPITEVIAVYYNNDTPVYVLRTKLRSEEVIEWGKETSNKPTKVEDTRVVREEAPVIPIFGKASRADITDLSSLIAKDSYVEPKDLADLGQLLVDMRSSTDYELQKQAKESFRLYKKYVKAHSVKSVYHYIDEFESIK